ncbi:MAG: alpha/beta hydrolase [Ignavibacteria bacterium]|nr:alpha/beta hydrolase [Ignavibacteria bacterium]
MKFIHKNIELSFESKGDGIPLLLIHGFPLSKEMWNPQINFLSAKGIKAITIDLRGFGESSEPPLPFTITDLADDVIDLLNHLKIDKCFIGGMSMGGYVLLNLLERFQERFLGAIFIATRANADDEAAKERRTSLIKSAKEMGIKTVTDAFKNILFADKTHLMNPKLIYDVELLMLKTSLNGIIGGLEAIRERKDYVDFLSEIKIPSLIVHGKNDKAVQFQNAELIADKIPNSKLVIIEEGGHMVNLECPEQVNDSILKFILNKSY